MIRLCGWSSQDGIRVLRKEPPQSSLPHPPCEGTAERRPSVNQDGGECARASILGFQPPSGKKRVSVVYEPPSPWCSVTAA